MARIAAIECPSYTSIAAAIGVDVRTVHDWLDKGKSKTATPLQLQFSQAIHGSMAEGERTLTRKISGGDSKDAAWLLTHSPFFREQWSDAAATRREVQKAMNSVVQAIEASSLTADQRIELFTRLGASGMELSRADH